MSMFLHLVNKNAYPSGGLNFYFVHRSDNPTFVPPPASVWPWLALGFLGVSLTANAPHLFPYSDGDFR